MKIKSENTAKRELIVISLLMILKTVFTQPLYSNLLGIGSGGIGASVVASALGALVFSVALSFALIKAADKVGESATPVMLLAIAEPLLVTTVSSLFHALAAIITVIWVAVCLTSKNKIVSAAVSLVSAALISFIMPGAIFSFVVLGIIVLLISQWNESKAVGIISAAASAAVSAVLVSVVDIGTRTDMGLSGAFYNFGGSECNPISALELSHAQNVKDIFSYLGDAILASIPVIAAVIFVAVTVFGYTPDSTDRKKSAGKQKTGKVLAVIAIAVPYLFGVAASVVCVGVSGVMGFNAVPVAVILALAVKGNKAVLYALDKLNGFVKAHPIVTVISIVWMAVNTTAFVLDMGIFVYTTQFVI